MMRELLRRLRLQRVAEKRTFLGGGILSIEGVIKQSAAEQCPYCKLPLQIAAVTSRFFRPAHALFVCGECGLALTQSTEEPHVQSSMIRWRIRRLS
jgi:hypothetical protein